MPAATALYLVQVANRDKSERDEICRKSLGHVSSQKSRMTMPPPGRISLPAGNIQRDSEIYSHHLVTFLLFSLSQTFTILLQVHNQVSLSDFQCHLESFGGLCNPQEQSSLMLSRFLDSFQVSFLLLHLLFSFHADYFFIHRNLLSIYRHSNNCLII